jgi:2-dehydro-3-deoxyphosphogluconate aldolase/(4S)-4-hydroxy-2-oxoglutarate aldolase
VSRRESLYEAVTRDVIIGVVREDDPNDAWEIARVYAENGVRSIEITLTTPEAFKLISRVVEQFGSRGVTVAAGTVRSGNAAAVARRAGAQILVSPHTDLRVIEYAMEHDLLCIAGAATVTEIVKAWEAGASIVKVYPADLLGGPEYFRTIRQPIRDVPMLAGGPVKIESIESYLDAGAVAVNLGGSLAVPDLVRTRNWTEIGRRVSRAVAIVNARRKPESVLVH